jgi:formylglycine-generating enzyme required for sulfatase activity/dienelactone hydrolase
MTRRTILRTIAVLLAVPALAVLLVALFAPAQGSALQFARARPGDGTPAGTDVDKLRDEVRELKEQLADLRYQIKGAANYLNYAPDVEVQNEDYANVRSRFRTKLVRKDPSPQAWSPVKPPSGVTEVEYRSGDLRLRAWVNAPADGRQRRPAVLFLHGGFNFDASDWYKTIPYRDAGFVVLSPILRGENGQPGSFSYFYDEVDDVLAAAAYLAAQPYVDPERLFLAGHSVGGTMTLLTALTSGRFCAAAAFSGAPFWPYFTEDKDLPFDRSDPREVQVRSPVAYAAGFKCPLRIYYGTDEAWFFGPMNRRIAALAKRRGLDVEAAAVEGGHRTHLPKAIAQSIAFFEKISSSELVPGNGKVTQLPQTVELDAGGGVTLKAVRIEPGKFQMGSPPGEAGHRNDEARHEVEIRQPFCIGVYPVTQAQYRHVMGMRPAHFSRASDGWDHVLGLNTDDFPVENVTWDEAMDFCRVLALRHAVRDRGWVVDLPSEAEWEYACRVGTETAYHVGDSLSPRQANFAGDYPAGASTPGRPTPVGNYEPNPRGLYDLHGNVLQWCKDWYDKDYRTGRDRDVHERSARGGSWQLGPRDCRSASRHPVKPTWHDNQTGFRVVVRLRGTPAD